MDTGDSGKGKMVEKGKEEEEKEKRMREISSSSSSIGVNSDDGKTGEEEENESEAQSKSGFDTMATCLESTLPHNKSISEFYVGRSKSFSKLSEACRSESAQDLAKAADPYSKKHLLIRKSSAGHKSLKTSSGAGIRIGGDMPSSETVTTRINKVHFQFQPVQTNPKGSGENLTSSASPPLRREPLQPPASSSLSHESASSPRRSSTYTAAADDDSDGNRRPNRSSTDLQSSSSSADDDDDDSDSNRRRDNASTRSNEGVDRSQEEPQN